MKIPPASSRLRASAGPLVLLISFLLLIHGACTGCQPVEPPHPEVGTPTQANTDGYNYGKDDSRTTDFIYNQLWYFNFLDEAQDVAGVAAYGLANPENLLFQQGLTNSFGMIIREETATERSFPVYSEKWDAAVPGNFFASETFEPGDGFEFQNPGGTIDVTEVSPGVHRYDVKGESVSKDGAGAITRAIYWDLEYTRGFGPSWRPWVDWPAPHTGGVFPAWISYHMNMPNAVVNGTFQVVDNTVIPASDVTYTLTNAKGYHDGFYSKFVFSIFEWDWLDFKQYEVQGLSEEISVHLLDPHRPEYSCQGGWETCTPGNLRVYCKGKEYNYYKGKTEAEKQIFITYAPEDEWIEDPQAFGVRCPPYATIEAKDPDGTLRLSLTWTRKRHMIVYYDVPAPFNDTVTYELISDFTGTFKDDSGNQVVINGPGWSDYSGPAFPGS